MKFTIVEHEGRTGLAYKWRAQCSEGCCESLGIEVRTVFDDEYVSMFIEAKTEAEIDGIIEGKQEKYLSVLSDVFSKWMDHLKEERLDEDEDEDEDFSGFYSVLPVSTRLH